MMRAVVVGGNTVEGRRGFFLLFSPVKAVSVDCVDQTL